MLPQEIESLDANDRGVALWEIISVVLSCLIAQWTIHSFAGQFKWIGAVPIVLALALMIFSHRERRENLRELGFRLDNLFAAIRVLILPTAIAIVLIVAASWLLSEADFTLRPRYRLLLVPAWALFQQYALQGFINRRAQIVFGPGWTSAFMVGAVFSVLHLPSPLLGLLALIGGVVWAKSYQRHPNLLALGLSHTAVSWALSLTIPSHYAGQLRIGFKYFGMQM
jgi:hypothetical protein